MARKNEVTEQALYSSRQKFGALEPANVKPLRTAGVSRTITPMKTSMLHNVRARVFMNLPFACSPVQIHYDSEPESY
ncbi:hypothetical protein EBZ39_14870 [bacterium]|nr:hypothetical protein [bacterium]